MIELRDVGFSYGARPFIEKLSLAVPPGTVTGLIGPNGSGKSTVLRLAAGILRPREGVVLLDGKDVHGMRPRDRAKRVALLHQGARVPRLTAWDVVMAARYPHRGLAGGGDGDFETARRAMEHTGAEGFAGKRMDQLSGGERQKVFMAAALAQETGILLLDEPTVYLDVSSAVAWMRFVREINKTEAKTVLTILHDLGLALRFCDRLILLANGAVAASGTPGELVESGILAEVLRVRIEAFQRDGERFYCYS